MKIAFSDGYDLLPIEYGCPNGIAYDGIRLALQIYEEASEVSKNSKRWFKIIFKPIWYSVNHTTFEKKPKAYIDIDPIDATGLFPAIEHAQFKGLKLQAFRFKHFDEMIRVITFNEPIVQEIPPEERFEKI